MRLGQSSRTGYLSLLLPVGTPEVRRPSLLRQLVVDALAATGEWPARVEIVTHRRAEDAGMQRWFVEYETGRPEGAER
jgi:hypothetical protein